ncbi:MAG: hypothetical protein ACRBHB_11045 [Arenicella sp.]
MNSRLVNYLLVTGLAFLIALGFMATSAYADDTLCTSHTNTNKATHCGHSKKANSAQRSQLSISKLSPQIRSLPLKREYEFNIQSAYPFLPEPSVQ